MNGRRLVLAAGVLVSAAALMASGLALFTDSASIGGNTFTTDTIDPPTGLSATGGASISLSWTATADTYASGHRVLRGTATGGPYTQIAEVTPRTTTAYTDSPVASTYFYVVRSFYQSWESANSNEVSATKTGGTQTNTGLRNCSSNAVVTTNSGDNNGFETTPANACADGVGEAQDVNTGSGAPDTCSSTSKDRHLFYTYGFALPAGSTVDGIEVRLDAWADFTSSSPFVCAELSWDGGVTWTAAQSTPNLGLAEATFTLGGVSDTWGRTWTVSELSDTNFRVRITTVAGFNGRDFFLDWAAVQVTYTPP